MTIPAGGGFEATIPAAGGFETTIPAPGGFETTIPSTGWTAAMPVIKPQQPPGPVSVPVRPPAQPPAPAVTAAPAVAPTVAAARTIGPRGRILVIEGGYGGSGRRPWGRGGSAQAPVLSAMLAAVSPQILLAAEAVDAVHLPGAADPQSVLAHLRAASRHPGPLLIHIGGHLIADRRSGHLHLTLRESKDGLDWQSIAAELAHRPAEMDTLVIADLSADQGAWPLVQTAISPLMDGLPLWAAVSPDPEQIGTFTRALIEALHGGRPGAEAVLAPEQLQQQVHSVLRPDVITLTSHHAERPVFRNTARQLGDGSAEPKWHEGPRPAAVMPKPPTKVARQRAADARAVTLAKPSTSRAAVSLLKPGVPPTPPRPARPVSLLKAGHQPARPTEPVSLAKPEPQVTLPPVSFEKQMPEEPAAVAQEPAAVATSEPVSFAKEPPVEEPPAPSTDYREVIGRIVRSADAGEHEAATALALELEQQVADAHGPASAAVLQVRQVRAHVLRLAGRAELAAEVYREVALALLRSMGAEHPETQQAATNAEACWRAVTDRAEAIRMAPEMIELRAYLPGPEGRKLRAAERYLKQLVAQG